MSRAFWTTLTALSLGASAWAAPSPTAAPAAAPAVARPLPMPAGTAEQADPFVAAAGAFESGYNVFQMLAAPAMYVAMAEPAPAAQAEPAAARPAPTQPSQPQTSAESSPGSQLQDVPTLRPRPRRAGAPVKAKSRPAAAKAGSRAAP